MIIRSETYDDSGLISVDEIEVPDLDIQQQIADKEAMLLQMYEELLALKEQQKQA